MELEVHAQRKADDVEAGTDVGAGAWCADGKLCGCHRKRLAQLNGCREVVRVEVDVVL